MTARGVFYPDAADTAEERLGLLRQPVPDRRGRRHVLRAAGPPDGRAVGRADAAGLHLRHQGPRADDRPADRGQAAAEGPARGAARPSSPRSRGSTPRTCPTTIRDEVWARFATRSQPLAEAGQLGSILLQYPRWFFTSSENRDTIEDATGRLQGRRPDRRGRVPERQLVQREEHRADAARSSATGPSRSSSSTGRRASSRACRRSSPRPSPDLAIVRFHGRRTATWEATGDPDGRALPLPVRRARAGRLGRRASATSRPRPRDTHVLFNNCYANYGSTNALELAQLLEDLQAPAA